MFVSTWTRMGSGDEPAREMRNKHLEPASQQSPVKMTRPSKRPPARIRNMLPPGGVDITDDVESRVRER